MRPEVSKPLADALARHGIVRRMLNGRRWHGADWWLVLLGGLLAVAFVVIGIAPGLFAPHDPQVRVGPRLLAPLEETSTDIMVARADDTLTGVSDLAGEDRALVGIVVGSTSGQVLRDEADRISEERRAAGDDVRIRVRIERFETLDQAFIALSADEVQVVATTSREAKDVLDRFPSIESAGSITGAGSTTFPFGTTQIGQDVFSRVVWGTRVALLIGFIAPIISISIGVPLGLVAGFVGGRVDRALSLVMDSLYAFPSLILAIAITAVLGPSVVNVIAALGVIFVPTYFRVTRGQTLATKELLFVEAARSLGAHGRQILRHFIAPNVIPSAVILFSVSIADAILTGAGLSFLGLGLPPDVADWGRDLARGQASIGEAWWLVVFPGSMITVAVLAFTLLGEGLVEIFNPRLRDR